MTKIRLSKKEKELIADSEWILTKNEILKKISRLLETLNAAQQNILHASSSFLPSAVMISSPKISRGENYKGLPWIVLDYPRVFQKEDICAVRTLFWWGNSFSITLHLSGEYKRKSADSIISSYPVLAKKNIHCCINDDQWQHHFERDNYTLIKTISENDFKKIVQGKPFLKLAKKISLKKWERKPAILLEYFNLFMEILKSKI